MTDTLLVLGQSAPSATTLTTLYTVPGATSVAGSSIVVCNRGSAGATFRIAVRPAGAAIATKHYLFYDASIAANATVTITIGFTLAATDVVSVYSSTIDLSFNAFGVEVT